MRTPTAPPTAISGIVARHHLPVPFIDRLPAPIWFRSESMPAEASYPQHRHPWGEFVYSFSGVMEIKLIDMHYLAPPPYGIWLPPEVEHRGLNRHEACHCSLYIAAEHCRHLPASTCALTVTPLLRALLEHLRLHPPGLARSEEETRLLQVVVDQLAAADRAGSYLPTSRDAILGPILAALEANPADERSLPELARSAHTSERTLLRRAQRELGMSLAEWRQRLCVVRAMPQLDAGRTVESIALDLGYASASAFITMFRKLTGKTPDEFRRQAEGEHRRMAKD